MLIHRSFPAMSMSRRCSVLRHTLLHCSFSGHLAAVATRLAPVRPATAQPRHFSRSSASPSPPPSSPTLSSRPPPPTAAVHTSADYTALRLHEQRQWTDQFRYPAYSNTFTTTLSVPAFVTQYAALEPAARLRSSPIRLAGRIMAKRTAGSKLAFLQLRAEEREVQVMCDKQDWEGRREEDEQAVEDSGWGILKLLRVGDIVGVRGFPGASKTGELSVMAREIVPLVPCLHDLPLTTSASSPASASSSLSIETRFRQRHLDMLLNPASLATLHLRSVILASIRSFLTARRYLEVDTPILWPSSGGALARPFLTHSTALSHPLYMRIAPELFLKRLVIGGVDRCFEVSKVFRNEGVDATHNPEFTTVEAYEAFGSYETMMELTEAMMRDVVRAVRRWKGESDEQLTVVLPRDEGETADELLLDFGAPFQRVDIMHTLGEKLGKQLPDPNDDASLPLYLQLFSSHNIPLPALPHTLPRLLDALIGEFLEPLCVQPTFLLHHPISLSPLALTDPARPQLTQRWELFIGGREYVNAYSELNDPIDQARRMAAQQQRHDEQGDDEAHSCDEEYVRAMEYGLPPTGGWGLGVDRLLMLLAGKRHIRDVIFFPVMKPEDGSKKSDKQ